MIENRSPRAQHKRNRAHRGVCAPLLGSAVAAALALASSNNMIPSSNVFVAAKDAVAMFGDSPFGGMRFVTRRGSPGDEDSSPGPVGLPQLPPGMPKALGLVPSQMSRLRGVKQAPTQLHPDPFINALLMHGALGLHDEAPHPEDPEVKKQIEEHESDTRVDASDASTRAPSSDSSSSDSESAKGQGENSGSGGILGGLGSMLRVLFPCFGASSTTNSPPTPDSRGRDKGGEEESSGEKRVIARMVVRRQIFFNPETGQAIIRQTRQIIPLSDEEAAEVRAKGLVPPDDDDDNDGPSSQRLGLPGPPGGSGPLRLGPGGDDDEEDPMARLLGAVFRGFPNFMSPQMADQLLRDKKEEAAEETKNKAAGAKRTTILSKNKAAITPETEVKRLLIISINREFEQHILDMYRNDQGYDVTAKKYISVREFLDDQDNDEFANKFNKIVEMGVLADLLHDQEMHPETAGTVKHELGPAASKVATFWSKLKLWLVEPDSSAGGDSHIVSLNNVDPKVQEKMHESLKTQGLEVLGVKTDPVGLTAATYGYKGRNHNEL